MISPARNRRGVVTGAGSGIGRAVALAHAARGRRGACRRHRCRRSLPNCPSENCTVDERRSLRSGRPREARGRSRWRRLSRQLARHPEGQVDLRGHRRRLAVDPDGQRRVGLLSLPADRAEAAAGRRDRQPVVEFRQARNDDRGRALCRLEDDRSCRSRAPSPTRSPSARCASTRSARASSTRRCRTRCWPVSRSCAAPMSSRSRQARNNAVPLGRAASADECAGAIWFLLSDEAAYMTGQAVNFTGGLVTW